MITLLGISGYARSGKDTAAQAVTNDGWTRIAFADALKQDAAMALRSSIVAGHHNPPQDELMPWFTDPTLKEQFRPFLVEYGRAMRVLYPDYWIERLALDITPGKCYVITDVRYANEAEWIRSRGGKVIEIVRPGVGPANNEEKNSMLAFKPDAHIYNSGTAEELHKRVAEYVKTAGE